MADPTKNVTRHVDEDTGLYQETTHEDLCSVELGATAKGDPQIKSVKVYSQGAQWAAEEALRVFRFLEGELGG